MPVPLSSPSASGGALVTGPEFFKQLVETLDAKTGGVKPSAGTVSLPSGPLKDLLERLDNQSLDRAIAAKKPSPIVSGMKGVGKGLVFGIAAQIISDRIGDYIDGAEEVGIPDNKHDEEEEIGLDVVRAAKEAITWAEREREKKRMRRTKKRRTLIHVWSRSKP